MQMHTYAHVGLYMQRISLEGHKETGVRCLPLGRKMGRPEGWEGDFLFNELSSVVKFCNMYTYYLFKNEEKVLNNFKGKIANWPCLCQNNGAPSPSP